MSCGFFSLAELILSDNLLFAILIMTLRAAEVWAGESKDV